MLTSRHDHTPGLSARDDFPDYAVLFLFVTLSTLVLFCCAGGPDYSQYSGWGKALVLGNPDYIPGETLSPSGMPESGAGHATGFILSFFSVVLPKYFDATLSAQCVGVLLFVVCSASLWGLMDVIELRPAMKVFVFSLFLAGTNSGYYFIYLSSEAVTSAIVLSLSWLTLASKRNTPLLAGALGAGSCMLVTCRPHAALAAIPLVGVFGWRELRNRRGARSLLLLVIVSLGVAAGVLQVMQINQWMTGSWLHSSFAFGNDTFHSLGWPRFVGRVLLSRRVGLLVFTPLMAVAFVTAFRISFQKSQPVEWRIFFALACIVNIANLGIVSSYYAWSGGSSFASRYFIPTGLLLLLSLPIALRDWESRRHGRVAPLVVSLFAIPTILALNGVSSAAPVAAIALALALAVSRFLPSATQGGTTTLTALSTVLLSEVVWFALSRQTTISTRLTSLPLGVRQWGLMPLIVFMIAVAVNQYVRQQVAARFDTPRMGTLAAVVYIALVLFQTVNFLEFRSASQPYRTAQIARPADRFRFRASFNLEGFSKDVDDGKKYYEFSDSEMAVARVFRDSVRSAATLPNR